jgi:RNA-binding protein
MNELTNPQLRKLKALAQQLGPDVKVGRNGVSDPFLKNVDDALSRRELIKIKFDEFKDQKKELAPQIAEKTSSRLVMMVGNVFVLYRQQPDPERRVISI